MSLRILQNCNDRTNLDKFILGCALFLLPVGNSPVTIRMHVLPEHFALSTLCRLHVPVFFLSFVTLNSTVPCFKSFNVLLTLMFIMALTVSGEHGQCGIWPVAYAVTAVNFTFASCGGAHKV